MKNHHDGSHFFVKPGAVSAVWSFHISEQQRRIAGKWPRPFGLCQKGGQPALLFVHLDKPNLTHRALFCRLFGNNLAIPYSVNRPLSKLELQRGFEFRANLEQVAD